MMFCKIFYRVSIHGIHAILITLKTLLFGRVIQVERENPKCVHFQDTRFLIQRIIVKIFESIDLIYLYMSSS